MEKIITLTDRCQFRQAKDLLQKELEHVDGIQKGWTIQMTSVYLTIKEKEHQMSLKENDLQCMIEKLLFLLQQMQGFDINEELLLIAVICCTNCMTLVNTSHGECNTNSGHVIDATMRCLFRGIKLLWNDTRCLPPHSLDLLVNNNKSTDKKSTNDVFTDNVRTDNERVLNTVFSFYLERTIHNCRDPNLLGVFLALLMEVCLASLINEGLNELQGVTVKLLHHCINQFNKLPNKCNFNKSKHLSILFHQVQVEDFVKHFEILRVFYQFPCVSSEDRLYDECSSQVNSDQFNPLLFIVHAILLLYHKHYEKCMECLQRVQSSVRLVSKFTLFQLFLFNNINDVVHVKLHNKLCREETIIPPGCMITGLLNQTAVVLRNENTERSIELLQELLTYEASSLKNTHIEDDFDDGNMCLVTSIENRMEVYLQKKLAGKFSYVELEDEIQYFLYTSKVPRLYVLEKLARQFIHKNRYYDASETLHNLTGQLEEEANNLSTDLSANCSDLNGLERVYQQTCFCFLKCGEDEKAYHIIGKFKEKGMGRVWIFLYEAEVYRKRMEYSKSITALKRGLQILGKQRNYAGIGPTKQYSRCHIMNNMSVAFIQMDDFQQAFGCIKNAISACRSDSVPIFEELAYNYCKWLCDHKTRDLALRNWREFEKVNVSTSTPLFHNDYRTVI